MAKKIPDPYAHIEFRGRPLDNATAAACVLVEIDLGYRLTLLQGIGGAPASGGTHLLGRAVDAAPYDAARKEKSFRDIFGLGYHRLDVPRLWSEHVHAINIFLSRQNTKGLAPSGFRQIALYDAGLDALVDNKKDPNPYRPSPKVVFSQAQYEHVMTTIGLDGGPLPTKITKVRDSLVEADADLGAFIAGAKDAGLEASDWKWAQQERVQIRHRLDTMAKR